MKSLKFVILLLIFMAFLGFGVYRIYNLHKLNQKTFSIIVVYNHKLLRQYGYILEAYKSVLEEEGVIYELVDVYNLFSTNPKSLAICKPVLIFPDGVNQILPPEILSWIKEYMANGGNVFLSFDVGIKDMRGNYREEALFSYLLGVNYITYKTKKDKCYSLGYILVDSKDKQEILEIPSGKLINGTVIGGYAYGRYEYKFLLTESKENFKDGEVLAWILARDGKKYPGIIIKKYYKGNIIYANLSLGYLKAFADDFILRTILRVFLFKFLKIPHLVNTPYGKGGLIFNWHVDSSIDWLSIPYMIKNGYFTRELEFSIHITAGDFRDRPGDKLGFDACGEGKKYVKMVSSFGVVGSHGGWAHNFFSENVVSGVFGEEEIYEYIKRNTECLESIVGYKILEYSAPNGVHSQPETTKVLEKLGFNSYYYTGDNGSSPNRTFINGRMVSDKLIAFPISSMGKYASFDEMLKGGIKEREVEDWLFSIADYVIKYRTIRLIYSHPYDVPLYPRAIKDFIDYLVKLKKADIILVKPMSYFAEFLLRFLETKYEINFNTKEIKIENTRGLEGITLAVPKQYFLEDLNKVGLVKEEDEDFLYITITKDYSDKKVIFKFNKIQN